MMSQFSTVSLFLVLVPFLSFAQITKRKEIRKNYQVAAGNYLAIDSRFGDIHIETWLKDEVDITVNIEITKGNEAKARQYLNDITIAIDDTSADDLSLKTMFNGDINNGRNDRMKIEYRIKVPKYTNLQLKNRYGNLFLADSQGKTSIDVTYGNIKIGELTGDVALKLTYGNGEVDKVSNGEINARYSNLEIDNAGNVEVDNSYSKVDFGTSKDVDLSNKYGKMTWESLYNLRGYSKYGSVVIDKLYNSLIFAVKYGGGVDIDWISKDFVEVNLEGAYAGVTLKFQRGMSAMLDAEMKYCDLKYADIEFDYRYIDKSGSMKYYQGKLGTGDYASKIKINSAYGNVKLSYAD